MQAGRTATFLFVGASLASLMLAGCGGGDRPPLGYVTGTVTMNGEPLGNVIVVMKPDDGRAAMVQADDQGHYEMEYIKGVKGTKLGPTTVSFEWPLGYDAPMAIPRKYSAGNSEVKFDVVKGNNVQDFELESTADEKPALPVE